MIQKIFTDSNESLKSRSLSDNSLENCFSIQKESQNVNEIYTSSTMNGKQECDGCNSLVDNEELLRIDSHNIMSNFIQDSKSNSNKQQKLIDAIKKDSSESNVHQKSQKLKISHLMGSTLEDENFDHLNTKIVNLKGKKGDMIKGANKGSSFNNKVTINKFEITSSPNNKIKPSIVTKELHQVNQDDLGTQDSQDIEKKVLALKEENRKLLHRNKILTKEKEFSVTVYQELRQKYEDLKASLDKTNTVINQSVIEYEEHISKEIDKKKKDKTQQDKGETNPVLLSFIPIRERLKKLRRRVSMLK